MCTFLNFLLYPFRPKWLNFLFHVFTSALLVTLLNLVGSVPVQAQAQPTYNPDNFLTRLSQETAYQLSGCDSRLADAPELHILYQATDNQGTTYYGIRANYSVSLERALPTDEGGAVSQDRRPWGTFISVNSANQCQIFLESNQMQPVSWLELMPIEAAQQFALQDLQLQIKLFQALGQDPNQVLRDRLNALAQSNGQLYPDQAWAFEQLGYTIPDSIEIADPPQETSSGN